MRHLLALTACCFVCVAGLVADDNDKGADDTPKAAKARKMLKTKIDVDFKDTKLTDALDEIREAIKEKMQTITFKVDNKGGVSNNTTFTLSAKDTPLEDILAALFKKNDMGYYVISGKKDAYDGSILIKKGKERGYPLAGSGDNPKPKDKKK